MEILALLPFISALLVTAFGYPTNQTGDGNSRPLLTYYHKNLVTVMDTIRSNSFGRGDLTVGALLDWWNIYGNRDPEEFGTYYQGDILTLTRLKSKSYLWENGVVPYVISDDFADDFDRNIIMAAISEFHMHTCIKFKPYDPNEHTDYIQFENDHTGCWSSIGCMGNKQIINLQSPACTAKVKTILHELGHALGLPHEHTRPMRDAAVIIKWENIKRGSQGNFVEDELEAFDIPYDYDSIMHYSAHAYSGNHHKTIQPKSNEVIQRTKLSTLDIAKLRILYKCDQQSRLY